MHCLVSKTNSIETPNFTDRTLKWKICNLVTNISTTNQVQPFVWREGEGGWDDVQYCNKNPICRVIIAEWECIYNLLNSELRHYLNFRTKELLITSFLHHNSKEGSYYKQNIKILQVHIGT